LHGVILRFALSFLHIQNTWKLQFSRKVQIHFFFRTWTNGYWFKNSQSLKSNMFEQDFSNKINSFSLLKKHLPLFDVFFSQSKHAFFKFSHFAELEHFIISLFHFQIII
jgi:hypothetical protein